MSLLFYPSPPSVYFVSFTSNLTSNILSISLADTQLHLIYSEDINTSTEWWMLFITVNKQWHSSYTLIQETWKLRLIRVRKKTSSYTDPNVLLSFWQSAVPDKVWTFLLPRHQIWRQPEGGVGRKCSLHMKTCKTGTQILAVNQDGQEGKAQAGTTQEWGLLFPVKLKEFTTDFYR